MMDITVKGCKLNRAKAIIDAAAKELPEKVYVIRVMTRKDGKARKKKAWARKDSNGRWRIGGQSLAWLLVGSSLSVWTGLQIMKKRKNFAEAALGCQCKVAAIELKEVECE